LVVMFMPDGVLRTYQAWRKKGPSDYPPLEAPASIVEATG